MDLQQLVHQVKKKEVQAEKALYDFCFQHCFKIALVYCADKTEAIAVFNHALSDLFDHLDQLDNPDHLLKWVARTVKNDCIDHIRKKTAYRNKLMGYAEQPKSTLVFNEALSTLNMENIIELIHQLKPDYRLCFVLKEIDGYTFREIAEELSINENTAKWYVHEAKKILQKKLVHLGYTSSNQ